MSESRINNLARSLVSPDVVDFWASHISRRWSWDRTFARVVSVREEARDTVSIELEPNRHFAGFQSGQHINVTVEINGVRLTRSYSPTNLATDRRVCLTIKANKEGKVSRYLCNEIGVGDVLELGPAFGEMTLADDHNGPWLFLAAGSGITPIMSLLRELGATRPAADVTLMYWVQTRADLCFAAELESLAAQHTGFRFFPVLTREAPSYPDGLVGRADANQIAAVASDLSQHQVYACGSYDFVTTVTGLVSDQASGFHSEAFSPPTFDGDCAETITVTHARNGRTLELPAGMPLLAALEAAGESPAYGCRMGICNTCVCGKGDGVVEDMRNGQSSHESQSALKICVNAARTDITLDW